MDIVRPLPTPDHGYRRILTIQDLLTKYSVAVLLKQATSSEIAEALVEEFCQFVYRAENLDHRSWFEFYMRHIAGKYKISVYKTCVPRHTDLSLTGQRSYHVLMEYLKQWSRKHDWEKYVTHAMKA